MAETVRTADIKGIDVLLLLGTFLGPGNNCRYVLDPETASLPSTLIAWSICSGLAELSLPTTVGPTASSTRTCL